MHKTPEELIAAELAYWAKEWNNIDRTTNTRPRPHSTRRDKVTHSEMGQIWGTMRGLAYALELTRNGEDHFIRVGNSEWWQIMTQAISIMEGRARD